MQRRRGRRPGIRIETGRGVVEVDLRRGGRLARLEVDGLSLLVPEREGPLWWGCYVMAPFAGRVREGAFAFAGRTHTLVRNVGEHAAHGTVFDRPWTQVGPDRLRTDLGPSWPWRGEVEQQVALDDDGLTLRLRVTSAGEAFPASVGWHPWFRRRLDHGGPVEVDIDPEAAYALDGDLIPTGAVVPPPPPPWDTPFTGMRRPPRVTWPGALELEITSSARRWVVFTQHEQGVCVEPQTVRPDALGSEEVDVVTPDRPLEAWMRIAWRPAAAPARRQ